MKIKVNKQKNPQPELSIGIIFKNNIRSLERCLKALTPLREKLLCQLVMADTGSTDGSRQVAAKYADVLFDFPWIDDFSAARNAVMDRCTGRWYIGVDSDEYLDKDITELFLFLTGQESRTVKVAAVVVRNYTNYEMDGPYSDFYAVRMVRMSCGFRYQGEIHEKLICGNTPLYVLHQTVFHHDGYVGLYDESGREKRERNITALRKKLEQKQDLLTMLQFIESGAEEPDLQDWLRRAVSCVKARQSDWQHFGAPVMRHAVNHALQQEMPEQEEWIGLAEEMFPNSYFVRIDIEHIVTKVRYNKGDYDDCVCRGERCLDAYADYRTGQGDMLGQLYSTLSLSSPQAEQGLRIVVASGWLNKNNPERAYRHLSKIDFQILSEEQVHDFVKLLRWTYTISRIDTAPLLKAAWVGVCAPTPSESRAINRKNAFIQESSVAFQPSVWKAEMARKEFVRLSGGAFAPLAGQCDVGTAARIIAAESTEEIEELLRQVKIWEQLPVVAIAHAIKQGAQFPPVGMNCCTETLSDIARRLAANGADMLDLIRGIGQPTDLSSLCWQRAMVFAAMRIHEWKGGENDLPLARAFAEVERAFLPVCYAEAALREENLFLLPPTHRFGWYCDKAFAALDSGDRAGYVRYLHGGLSTYEDMRGMIEVLLEDFQRQEQLRSASPELLALAEQVRTMLAAYPPDDPAVAALKQSEAYRRVAKLVEEPAVKELGSVSQ